MSNKVVLVAILILVGFFSCKNNNKTSEGLSDQGAFAKDLDYHLANALKDIDNSIGVEQKFNNEVYLRGFAFYEKNENHYDLILELQDDITEDVVSKYTFAVEGFVTGRELDNLSDYAKKKNRTNDSWYGTPKLIKINNHCYVIIDVNTKLKDFEVIKFFLYDKAGYKGDIGKRILFYDYRIK